MFPFLSIPFLTKLVEPTRSDCCRFSGATRRKPTFRVTFVSADVSLYSADFPTSWLELLWKTAETLYKRCPWLYL